ncbi:MAG TPA: hypothetical protein VFO31_30185, partial [Vicinamibacterales bacterium]|nr:hypothetical protein [Vicinamibacterales bacterium]
MRAVVTMAVLLAAAAAASAQPVSPDAFRHERTVTVKTPGPQRLDVDAVMLAGTQAVTTTQQALPLRRLVRDGPPDLRLYTQAGVEVPFLFVPPTVDGQQAIDGSILPIAPTKTTSGFEVDFHEVVPALSGVTLEGIPAPFLKRFRLEGSGDRVRWTVLVNEGTAFDLPAEHLRSTTLTFTTSATRFLRVTWDDTNSARAGLPSRATSFRLATVHTSSPLRVPLQFERRSAEPGTSRFHVRLPGSRLPIDALELSIGGGHLLRDVRVLEARLVDNRRGQVEPVETGRARLRRVVRDGQAAEDLRVRIQPPSEPDLDLVFDDGDNPPIDLQGVTAVFAELPWIYFESQPGTLIARYGNAKTVAPRYDLEAARTSIPATVSTVSWGTESERPAAETTTGAAPPMPARGSALVLSDFRHARTLASGPQGLTVVPLDVAAYAHSSSQGGAFSDVRILDRDGLQVPYLLEKRDEPLVYDLRFERREPSPAAGARPGGSEYVVPIPYRELSGTEIVLTTGARVFERTVRIGVLLPPDRQGRTPGLAAVQTQVWRHDDDAVPARALTLTVPDAPVGDVVIEIDEGDNQPLPIERATLLVPSYAVRFFRADAAPLLLAYGRPDLPNPRYDLALLAPYV